MESLPDDGLIKLMVCPNCHSKDLIDVQGQKFCTACGQLVSPLVEVSAVEQSPVQDASTEVTSADLPAGIQIHSLPGVELPAAAQITKRRKPGRPKSGRLDAPKTESPALLNHTRTVVPSTAPHIPEAPRLQPHAHRLNDIAPQPKVKLAQAPIPPAVPAGYGEITVETWRERFHLKYLFLAGVPAVSIALLAGGIAAVFTNGSLQLVVSRTQEASVAVAVEITLIGCLYYIGRSLGHSAILYGAARRSDHRPAPLSRWVGVAVNSFGRRLGFDIVTNLAQLAVLGLMLALVLTGGIDWQLPEWGQTAALFIAFLALTYLLTGLGVTQGFGRVGLTLAEISNREALGIGWNFFRRHFELVGVKLLGLVAELILIIPLAAATITAAVYVPHDLVWLAALVVALAVIICGALIGAGAAVWWQAAYRQLVRRDRITEAVHLLSSHQPERPRPAALIGVTILATVFVLAATIWPWLPWSG